LESKIKLFGKDIDDDETLSLVESSTISQLHRRHAVVFSVYMQSVSNCTTPRSSIHFTATL